MRDPGVGAFGMATGASAILLRWAALAALKPSFLLLGGIWSLSRTAMAVAVRTTPYARATASGLATAFLESERTIESARKADTAESGRARQRARSAWPVATTGAVIALAGMMAWRTPQGLAVFAAEVAGACGVVLFSVRKIGGYTGDVLGAAGVVAETWALLVAAVRW
jgi:adenosylcobinamide-GDP ribazoletransferase